MKRLLHLTFGMAALLTLGTACTAEDPANGLDIDQVIYAGDYNPSDPGGSNNPLNHYIMSEYSFNDRSCGISFNVNGDPIEASTSFRDSYYNDRTSQFRFEYLTDDVVSSVKWSDITDMYYDEQIEKIEIRHRMDNLSFEDGLLKSLIYSGEKKTYYRQYWDSNISDYVDARVETETLAGHDVKFDYDGRNLVKITVDGAEYVQKWSNGDLVEINSPYYGVSTLEYGTVENRYRQWDPTMPLMGFFQTLGWFGDAPLHFPKSIRTSALDVNNGNRATVSNCGLDYYINYDGLIETVRWSVTLNDYKECRLGYVNR